MKVLSSEQIRQADAYTIANEPIPSIDLMERAAIRCFEWITERFDAKHEFHIFCGTGNNGGDGLVIARKLSEKGYKVKVFIVRFSNKSSDDFRVNEKRLAEVAAIECIQLTNENTKQLPATKIPEKLVIIDAIFGSGLTRPIEGFMADVVHQINSCSVPVIAIDIPSGLFTENNATNNHKNIIEANYTLTFEVPKLALLFPDNNRYVGEWDVLPIGLDQEFIARIASPFNFITSNMIKPLVKERNTFSHKGTYGHALIVSGSYGKIGATVLASKACIRVGVGLLSVYLPHCGYNIIQKSVPEAMAIADSSEHHIANLVDISIYSAIGIGPGIGVEEDTQRVLKLIIQNASRPLVLDADALNILAENKTWISFLPKSSILTPHPKEFERLVGKTSDHYERLQQQMAFAIKHQVYVVLKGAYSTIACPDGEVFFNSTGNPGMATGGSGDVLTGVITGLLAQGYGAKAACLLGVYLHGVAGDIAAEQHSQEAMIAGDIVDCLGEGYKYLHTL